MIKLSTLKNHSNLLLSLVFMTLLGLFMLSTTPTEDNFALSFVPLVIFWLALYFLVISLLGYIFKSLRYSLKNAISLITSSSAVLAIMFTAVGQLSAFDIALLVALVAVGTFYFSRTWPK